MRGWFLITFLVLVLALCVRYSDAKPAKEAETDVTEWKAKINLLMEDEDAVAELKAEKRDLMEDEDGSVMTERDEEEEREMIEFLDAVARRSRRKRRRRRRRNRSRKSRKSRRKRRSRRARRSKRKRKSKKKSAKKCKGCCCKGCCCGRKCGANCGCKGCKGCCCCRGKCGAKCKGCCCKGCCCGRKYGANCGCKGCKGECCGRRCATKTHAPSTQAPMTQAPSGGGSTDGGSSSGGSGGITPVDPTRVNQPELPEPPFTPSGGSPTNAAEEACYKKHNEYRAIHGMPALKWDSGLRQNSLDWAQYITNLDQLKHTPKEEGKLRLGENLAMNSSPDRAGANGVEMWYMEICLYKKAGFSMGTGHYTQVVWKGSQYVGCAVVQGPNGVFTVAQYYPPGNFMGQFPENTGDPTTDTVTKSQQQKLC